jgi:hypothetical protein
VGGTDRGNAGLDEVVDDRGREGPFSDFLHIRARLPGRIQTNGEKPSGRVLIDIINLLVFRKWPRNVISSVPQIKLACIPNNQKRQQRGFENSDRSERIVPHD